ncbi:hypothetical protein [Flavobacterium sp. GP15]|uniref:hypothetical protein n=1 Tax=Flavobacterium sp. GP15 TaxID=2758567 RepID=UPI00165D972B|nr:hypothetical protein [Flavobacterium sp. GP15]
MEPDNFEEQFKAQLNVREIKPTPMAWEKLDSMLTAAEKPKSKFSWIYIAASFVGFLMISTFYFNTSDSVETKTINPIVLEQKANDTHIGEPIRKKQQGLSKTVQNGMPKSSGVLAVATNSKSNLIQKSNALKDSSTRNPINSTVENSGNTIDISKRYSSAEKLLAEISNTNYENKAVQPNNIGITVSANSLLSDAETELNQSFREKALDKFSKNYNAIKTVLVNRNYQD